VPQILYNLLLSAASTAALNELCRFLFLYGFKTGGDVRFIYLEAQTLDKKQSSFSLFVTQWGHRHCLATIAFILDIYLWWLNM